MYSVFVLALFCVLGCTEAISLNIYQPQYSSWCFREKLIRVSHRSKWVPNCDIWGVDYEQEQCDEDGNCWCVDEFSGQALYSYGFHRHGEVDCKKSQYCSGNKIYQNCGNCSRTCYQRNIICPTACRQGCFCPSNYFLLAGRCVPATQCPSILIPRATTRATVTPKEATTPEISKETLSTVITEVDIDNQGSGSGFEKIETTFKPIRIGAKNQRCNETMVYSTCGGCVKTCDQRHKAIPCTLDCKIGCTCPRNTYLHEGKCVTEDQCPPSCPENQIFSSCGSCKKTCAERNEIIVCSQACTVGCNCPIGMFLDGERCVTPNKCPQR